MLRIQNSYSIEWDHQFFNKKTWQLGHILIFGALARDKVPTRVPPQTNLGKDHEKHQVEFDPAERQLTNLGVTAARRGEILSGQVEGIVQEKVRGETKES